MPKSLSYSSYSSFLTKPQEVLGLPSMELRSTFTTCFFLLLILALPCFSAGGSEAVMDSSEVYEIDYRGPETHASVPPPHHSHGNARSSAHRKITVGAATAKKGLMGSNHRQQKAKKNP